VWGVCIAPVVVTVLLLHLLMTLCTVESVTQETDEEVREKDRSHNKSVR